MTPQSLSAVFSRLLMVFVISVLSGCASPEHQGDASAPAMEVSPDESRPADLANTEFAMFPGEAIIANTPEGTIEIRADDWLKRSYTWEGATRSVIMWPRRKRWYGSLGVYFPGPGDHWENHGGITRGVVQEGQQHFDSVEAAMAWIDEQLWMPYVYRNDGLMVGWMKVPERNQVSVDVYQIMINGRNPNHLPGADDSAIRRALR